MSTGLLSPLQGEILAAFFRREQRFFLTGSIEDARPASPATPRGPGSRRRRRRALGTAAIFSAVLTEQMARAGGDGRLPGRTRRS